MKAANAVLVGLMLLVATANGAPANGAGASFEGSSDAARREAQAPTPDVGKTVDSSVGAATGEVEPADDADAPPSGQTAVAQYAPEDARRQLEAGEFGAAAVLAEAAVHALEETGSRYDSALVAPLVVLGDAHRGMNDHDAAIGAYERALFLTRINDGLHGPDQLDIVYRQAEAYLAKGDAANANHRFEYAYQIMRRAHGVDDTAVLPALLRLADWYEGHHFLLAARELYEHALRIAADDRPSRCTADLLVRYARTFLRQAYPTLTPGAAPPGFVPRPTGAPVKPKPGRLFGQPIEFNKYVVAERSLAEAVQMTDALPDASAVERAASRLELGDWKLMFREWGDAFEVYGAVWQMLAEADPELLRETLGVPTELYLRHPGDPNPMFGSNAERDPMPGRVEYAVRVTARGEVRDIRTVSEDPDRLDYIKYRQALSKARYRPAFVDGEPVATDDVRVVFEFVY